MLCSRMATRRDGQQFPCGQCLNCRINHRRGWQSRLLLEAASHAYSAFVTLTFRDVGVLQVLRRSDIKFFTKQLGTKQAVRYFAAAEYGTKKGRAHYHVHLFSAHPITQEELVQAWPYGDIHIGNTEPASLDYTLGYLLKPKKETKWLIEKSWPEFRAFSQGIGKLALPHLLLDGCVLPVEYRVYGKHWPIPRYLRDRAKKMGLEVSPRKPEILAKLEAESLRNVLADKNLTAEQVEKIYSDYAASLETKRAEARKKAIRDNYREKNYQSLQRNNGNETF